jgi:hypothetical protein
VRRIRIDTVAPTVEVGGAMHALAAPEYRQGEHIELRAVCDDATSGVAACGILEAPDGLVPTTDLGDHELTLYGVDVAGNRTETSYAYRVVEVPAGGGGAGGGTGGAGGGTGTAGGGSDPGRPATAAGRPEVLAHTGVDLAGIALIGGLLAGAGAAALGARRMLRR